MPVADVAPVITNLADLPVVLTLKEVAAIYRVSTSTIRRGLSLGTFHPRPFEHYPYRWKRDDVIADFKRARPEPPRRPHGFAHPSAKLRPAKMKLSESSKRRAK